MDKQAREAREAYKQLPFKKRLENFWYYYRWALIGGIFLIVVLAFTISECAKRIPEDLTVSYYSESAISQEVVSRMQTVFGASVEDLDGDMQKYVSLSPVSGKIDEMSEQAMAVQQKFQVELAAGSASAYVFDQGYFDRLTNFYPEAVEKSIDMTQNAELKELLQLGDEPLYYVVRSVYANERGKEKNEQLHQNALSVYDVIDGTAPLPEVNFEQQEENKSNGAVPVPAE